VRKALGVAQAGAVLQDTIIEQAPTPWRSRCCWRKRRCPPGVGQGLHAWRLAYATIILTRLPVAIGLTVPSQPRDRHIARHSLSKMKTSMRQ
jgi:hypothetical protein